MEKVIRDGMVAVLYSPGFGAGWYSWNTDHEQLLFHPKLVEMVESGNRTHIDDDWVKENLGIYVYTGGAYQLKIEWIKQGTAFTISEYDGSESIHTIDLIAIIA